MANVTARFLGVLFTLLTLHTVAVQAQPLPELGGYERLALLPDEQATIGQTWMRELRASGAVSTDPIITDYIKQLGQRLSFTLPDKHSYKFFAVNSNELNAFAFFDNHVAIHLGLINMVQSESELASVCAHELAHLTQNHLTRQLAAQRKLLPITMAEAIAAIALGTPDLAIAALAGHMQHSLNYSREHEQEADRIGMDILEKAGFDPQGMPSTFERMKEYHKYYDKRSQSDHLRPWMLNMDF